MSSPAASLDADNFLNIARDALRLNFGEIELQPPP